MAWILIWGVGFSTVYDFDFETKALCEAAIEVIDAGDFSGSLACVQTREVS